ncbi:Uncharacterised protein [Yersinia mollaretii]|nr:Uncharacterised protein [Yersinia mollaretii]CQQ44466.1 Uncharacterised protein [Yersinia mollaretii]
MGIVPTSEIESIDCGCHTHRELYAKNRKKGGQNDRPDIEWGGVFVRFA